MSPQNLEPLEGRSNPQSGTYIYDKLPRGDVFRYLILEPGVEEEPLRCSLHTATMSETQFEAISYVWGSSNRDQDILCDGDIMKITTNLSKVLRRVRLLNAPRKLWADSICINQDDWEEKGHQVNIMGEIYRLAERVLIYMGPDEGGHAPQLCSLLDDVNQMINNTCEQIDMSWDSFPYPDKDAPILVDSRWESMYHLLTQDWFRRGWVVREAAFARYGEVIWGRSEFSWNHLMCTYIWLLYRAYGFWSSTQFDVVLMNSHTQVYTMRESSFAQIFYPESYSNAQSLLDDLEAARSLRLTDPRDRIYAFTELSHHSKRQLVLYPDYKSSYLELYRNFTIQYIRSFKTVEILHHVAHTAGIIDVDIPSWIARWDIQDSPISTMILSGMWLQSRDMSVLEPTVIDETMLKVRGVVWDEVQFVSDILKKGDLTYGVIRELWETTREVTVVSPYEMSQRLSAFLNNLSVAAYLGEWSQWRRSVAAFITEAQLEHETGNSIVPLSPSSAMDGGDSTLYFNFLKIFVDDKKLIVTKRGYMGLASSVTQMGDLCGIIFGCKTPCILRKIPQGQSYNFLGGTYVTGRQLHEAEEGGITFPILGHEFSKDWVDWDVEEQDIYLV
jgi:hypothetical protein